MRALLPVALALASAAADPACPTYPLPVALPSPLPAPLLALLEQIETGLRNSSLAGVAAQVSYKGSLLASFSSGLANVTGNVPFTVNTPSRAGSVSKAFTAALTMQLVAAGLLDLDDPVVKYEPAFAPIDPFNNASASITFRHLMSHTSGLQREIPGGANTTLSVLQAVAQSWLVWPVGTIPSYSNLGYALLGHVLEAVVPGFTFSQLMQRYVIAPLGLSATGFDYTPEVFETLAIGYAPSANGLVPLPFLDIGWGGPAGALYTTVSDLTTFTDDLMAAARGQPSKLGLPPTLAREFMGPVMINPDSLSGFSLPWELRMHNNYTVRNKGGNIGGYTALTSFVPALDLSVNILWNSLDIDEFGASDSVYPPLLVGLETLLFELAPPVPLGPSPGDYTGTYTSSPAGVTLTVLMAQGYLILVIPRTGGYTGIPLAIAGVDRFRPFFPPFTVPCFIAELQAFAGQYAVFSRDPNSGSVDGMTVPGYYAGFTFTRSASVESEARARELEEAVSAAVALASGRRTRASDAPTVSFSVPSLHEVDPARAFA